jgi:large exoprotein involved in heme utilization and adhesion
MEYAQEAPDLVAGRRFLANFTSDDQQYRALMDAGVTYAQSFKLRPGIALSAEQVARLTSDIVWLQQESVTLPDGSQTLALVPHVYLAPQAGDLAPSGGLMSGASLNITSKNGVTNAGTMLGRTVVQINADTIHNIGGNLRGNAVALSAAKDINNTGGTITAQDQLLLQAGRPKRHQPPHAPNPPGQLPSVFCGQPPHPRQPRVLELGQNKTNTVNCSPVGLTTQNQPTQNR